MDPNLRIAQEFRIEHRHADGSWSPLEPIHHGSADHDPERSWPKRTIYRCTSCEDTITLTGGNHDEGAREAR
jgi:hypothetical protein